MKMSWVAILYYTENRNPTQLMPDKVLNATLDSSLSTLGTRHTITNDGNQSNPASSLNHNQTQRCLDNVASHLSMNHAIDNVVSHNNQDSDDNQCSHHSSFHSELITVEDFFN